MRVGPVGLLATVLFANVAFAVRVERRSEVKALVARAKTISCGDSFWLTLRTCVRPHSDNTTFVVTGDINAMWIRDSSAQLHPYIELARDSRDFQKLLEGALRAQSKYIAIDPYANSYNDVFKLIEELGPDDARLLRGGYVSTANYELDSGPYFFRFLKHYSETVPSSAVVKDPQVHEACRLLVDMYLTEREHNRSMYRYPLSEPYELPGGSSGNMVGYTGMVWNAFRPSDDAHTYGFHIPGNIFLASNLPFVEKLAQEVWADHQLAQDARDLRLSILKGVEEFGTKEVAGQRVYCYEVDGLGNCNLMDDANIPSLLSLPYLDPTGTHHSREVYFNTRGFILSQRNPWFFIGSAASGIGSPHTGKDKVWPLALVMQALTANTSHERDNLLEVIITTAAGDKLHESFDKDNYKDFTRPLFGWPNALLAELVRSRGHQCGNIKDAPPFPQATPRDLSGLFLPSASSTFYTADTETLRFRPIALGSS